MFDFDREAFESLLSQVTTEIPSQIRRDFQSAEADLGFSVSDVEVPEKEPAFSSGGYPCQGFPLADRR